jgi:hypothetical protein
MTQRSERDAQAVAELVAVVAESTGTPVTDSDALWVVAEWLKQVNSYDDDPTGQIGLGIWRTARHLGLPVA